MVDRTQELATAIVEMCREAQDPAVPGSHIGTFVRDRFPDIDVKSEYGGVTGFLRAHCSDHVLQFGKSGADNLFVHRSRTQEVEGSGAYNATAWRAFTDPRLEVSLLVQIDSGKLSVIGGTSHDSVPEGFAEVPRLTDQDYREIAETFLQKQPLQTDNESREILQDAVESGWFDFVSAVEKTLGPEYRAQLLSWRLQQIRSALSQRLGALGLDQTAVQAAVEATRRPKRQDTGDQSGQRLTDRKSALSSQESRALMHVAVDHVGEDDLRKIWLPFGAIVDALAKRQ